MANQSGSDTDVIYLDSEKSHVLVPAMVYVTIMMVIGTTGNISVLYFYRFRCQQTTSTFCILAIASFDLCVCIFSMPVEIVDMKLFYKFNNVFVCKLDRFVTHFASIASAILLNFIAFERHRVICSPFKNKITPRQVKMACIFIVLSSIILSAPMTVFYDIIHVNVSYSGSPYEEGFECTTTKDESMEFYLLLTYVIHLAGFVGSALSLTLFYILIGHTLLKQRKFRIIATRAAQNLSVVGIRCRQTVRKAVDGSSNNIQKESNIPFAKEKWGRREGERKDSFQTQDVSCNAQRLSVANIEEIKDSDMASGPSILDFEEIKACDIVSVSSVSEIRETRDSYIAPMGPGIVVRHILKHDVNLTSETGSLAIAEIAHISPTLNDNNITDSITISDGNVQVDEALATDQPLGGSLVRLPAVGGIRGFHSNSSTTHRKSGVAPLIAMDDLTVEIINSDSPQKSLNNRQNRTVNANSSTTKYTLIMFLVSACFVLSFLPFLSLMVWRIYHNVQEVIQMSDVELILYSIGLRSYFLNSTVNPLIYGLFNTEFQSFFYGIICKCMQAKSRTST
ncbi:hypothetical protein CHS0354_016460 [Potamilus streckersoni]|uniref:G-protein coupled receptors family 1 profile domain-containing protein n=1 Tax=Potamilus streckersoni TaxID=2493646 RepID=A0AAE0TKA5_9BIVA|nr:hypothetical protein CHS0354_016460 [Potamilus streckersoni]